MTSQSTSTLCRMLRATALLITLVTLGPLEMTVFADNRGPGNGVDATRDKVTTPSSAINGDIWKSSRATVRTSTSDFNNIRNLASTASGVAVTVTPSLSEPAIGLGNVVTYCNCHLDTSDITYNCSNLNSDQWNSSKPS